MKLSAVAYKIILWQKNTGINVIATTLYSSRSPLPSGVGARRGSGANWHCVPLETPELMSASARNESQPFLIIEP